MYIVGYAVASVSFGHLVHTYPPFKLMAGGLFIWCIAAILSGAAPHFWVLVLARMLSGVGEASFQTVVPPFIDDNAPPSKRGLWLALFFMAIPVGTAVGYAWGGNIATALTWRWAFYIEAIPMVPMVALIWFMPYNKNRREALAKLGTPLPDNTKIEDTTETIDGLETIQNHTPIDIPTHHHHHNHHDSQHHPINRAPSDSAIGRELQIEFANNSAALNDTVSGHTKPSFISELVTVLFEPLFMSVVLGYAGYTAVMAGIGAFGPNLVEGLGLFSDQSTASLYFGGAVSVAGAIGTPFGGWLLDWGTKKRREVMKKQKEEANQIETFSSSTIAMNLEKDIEPIDTNNTTNNESVEEEEEEEDPNDPATVDIKLNVALPQAVYLMFGGSICCVGGVMLGAGNAAAFFGLLSLGALALCATTAGINQSIMASVRPESRSFAIGLGTLLVHAVGDVPAPTIIGMLADKLAPQTCTQDPRTGDESCTQSAYGLQLTITICLAWLIWPVLLWAVAWFIAYRRMKINIENDYQMPILTNISTDNHSHDQSSSSPSGSFTTSSNKIYSSRKNNTSDNNILSTSLLEHDYSSQTQITGSLNNNNQQQNGTIKKKKKTKNNISDNYNNNDNINNDNDSDPKYPSSPSVLLQEDPYYLSPSRQWDGTIVKQPNQQQSAKYSYYKEWSGGNNRNNIDERNGPVFVEMR